MMFNIFQKKKEENKNISRIVSNMIPDNVYSIINEFSRIDMENGEIEFFDKKSIDKAQQGFRYNPLNNEIINDWVGNSYIIIGYDCSAGFGPDPIIINIEEKDYPIYWLMTDGGDWNNPVKIADSLISFQMAYKKLLEKKNDLENKIMNDKDKELLINSIVEIVGKSNIEWWNNLISVNH